MGNCFSPPDENVVHSQPRQNMNMPRGQMGHGQFANASMGQGGQMMAHGGQMDPRGQMAPGGGMVPLGQRGQMAPGGQMGPGGQMAHGGQMGSGGQMAPGGQMGAGGQMGPRGQMGAGGQMAHGGQMGQGGQMAPGGQMGPGGQGGNMSGGHGGQDGSMAGGAPMGQGGQMGMHGGPQGGQRGMAGDPSQGRQMAMAGGMGQAAGGMVAGAAGQAGNFSMRQEGQNEMAGGQAGAGGNARMGPNGQMMAGPAGGGPMAGAGTGGPIQGDVDPETQALPCCSDMPADWKCELPKVEDTQTAGYQAAMAKAREMAATQGPQVIDPAAFNTQPGPSAPQPSVADIRTTQLNMNPAEMQHRMSGGGQPNNMNPGPQASMGSPAQGPCLDCNQSPAGFSKLSPNAQLSLDGPAPAELTLDEHPQPMASPQFGANVGGGMGAVNFGGDMGAANFGGDMVAANFGGDMNGAANFGGDMGGNLGGDMGANFGGDMGAKFVQDMGMNGAVPAMGFNNGMLPFNGAMGGGDQVTMNMNAQMETEEMMVNPDMGNTGYIDMPTDTNEMQFKEMQMESEFMGESVAVGNNGALTVTVENGAVIDPTAMANQGWSFDQPAEMNSCDNSMMPRGQQF